jgi:hypothetical protein
MAPKFYNYSLDRVEKDKLHSRAGDQDEELQWFELFYLSAKTNKFANGRFNGAAF